MTLSKIHTHHNGKTNSKQQSLKPFSNHLKKESGQQPNPATTIQRVSLDPGQFNPSDMQLLQRTFGNQAIGRLLAKTTQNQSIQKQSSALSIQAKLTIGQPNDHYEQEADRVASQVVQQINTPATAQSTKEHAVQRQEEPEEELQAKLEISALQRQAEPEEELQTKSTLHRREAIDDGQAPPELDSAINRARGGGQSLEPELQQSMGQAMGANFNGVRVHTDAQSDQMNKSIQARAFTTGQDVFFRQGAYQPASRDGQELIAHELTHVVQQNGGAVQRHIDRSTRMPASSYLARSPIFEYQHSNRGKEEIIQPKSYYKTDKSKNRQGLTGTVEVETAAVSVDLKGKMVGSEGEGVNAKGTVYMPEYKVADDRDIPPARIREQEGSGWDNYWTPSDALRVQNLSAEPRGVKLGQLLTYYHGLEARKRKKSYVIAMKVSDARGPFYAPLGFKDYNASKPWADLRQKHIELETTLRSEADNMTIPEIHEFQKKMAALKDEMEESAMIIGTEELITNAKQQFDPIWQED